MADDVVAHELIPPSLPAPFAAALSAGPYNFEFTASNRLRLSIVNSLVGVRVEVHYRVADKHGEIKATAQPLTPTSDRIVTTVEWTIGEGYLLNVTAVVASGSPKKGQTYVKLEALHGGGASATVLGTLIGGYVTTLQNLAWPGSPIESSIEGGGYTRVVTGTQPPAGSEISETVPTGARWRLQLFRARLINGNVAGTRQPNLAISTGSVIVALIANPGSSAINQVADYYWSAGLGFTSVMLNGVNAAGIAPDAPLVAGSNIATSTVGLNALDAWLAPTFTVQEWLEV